MDNICIPMHLDAFALSPESCKGESKIAPYTQLNYTALRLDSHLIQHDVLDHVTFHYSEPVEVNPRLADLGSNPVKLKQNRMGIHLHWSLPRFYRSSKASASSTAPQGSGKDLSNPIFQRIPNRWLVTRHLDLKTAQPPNVLKEYQSWIIESDVVRKITEIPDEVDLESDVTPFVAYSGDADDLNALKNQAEIFLGQRFDFPGWKEDATRNHMKLTVMNSSNPLFPDYAMHNTNVLSMIDNFAYPDPKPKNAKNISYLTDAEASYYVIGWHSDAADDPLTMDLQKPLSDRLSGLLLKLPDTTTSDGSAKDSATAKDSTRCLSYGAIYDVKYSYSKKPPTLADEAAKKFTADTKMEPLSVGTTALDGILTFLEAHKENTDSFFGKDTTSVANDLLSIATLLYATADEYDARVQAQDLIAQQNFARADGGIQWSFNGRAEAGGAPPTPSATESTALRTLNEAQSKLDLTLRQLRSVRWELFAEWWKYVSEYIKDGDIKARQQYYATKVGPLKDKVDKLVVLRDAQQAARDASKAVVTCKQSSNAPYYTRTDPTISVAGLDSGWPDDFTDRLTISFDSKLSDDLHAADAILGNSNPLPAGPDGHGLQDTAKRVLAACLKNSDIKNMPMTTGFQAWGDRNPFVPLFIEWESIYYHVDFNKWDVEVRPSPVGHPSKQVRYGINVDLSQDTASREDARVLSGRVLVLPQPVFNLEAIVLQVLEETPPDMKLTPQQILDVKNTIRKMKFISAPLSGLTNHLLTRCEGAHVKPSVRSQGQTLVPLKAASDGLKLALIDPNAIELMEGETALTPYGNLLDFGKEGYPGIPFKGVTHGQMFFTKINIIDKFGQAVCLPPPKPRLRHDAGPPTSDIYPCLSDYLAPDIFNGKQNTVYPSGPPPKLGDWPLCQYMLLTPSINQDARINASFLLRDPLTDGGFSAWREASDYEQPIFGWIIINYADYGLQFFLPDGSFYREIRMGGVHGVDISAKWIPFDPPKGGPSGQINMQLDNLINLFAAADDPKNTANVDYLQSFFDMINGAIQDMPYPPSEYSGFANAIVGKPLALVNVGWSIELSQPAIKAQNTYGNHPTNSQADLENYKFPLKIGDNERIFDGVVGYYITKNSTDNNPTDWSKLFTYFEPKVATDHFKPISPETFPKVSPYWLDPLETPNVTSATAAKYLITTMLMDPYTAIHAYSPILPTKALQLPSWSVQTAFDKMSAFFRLGPSLLANDVPQTLDLSKAADVTVRLPISGRKGMWNWLQPYAQDGADAPPKFGSMVVEEDQGKVHYAPAPYTFVEGYLQLAQRLSKKDVQV
ncbi:hypothetical protein MMC17_009078 [Xylographa soralifera]|nr:hypothetical protein [Xylographa soralifera]